MIRHSFIIRLREYFNLRYLILLLFGYILLNFLTSQSWFSTTTASDDNVNQPSIWTFKMKSFCLKVHQRVEKDKKIQPLYYPIEPNIKFMSPNLNTYTKLQHLEIAYRYSSWRSSPDLPRRLNPCDHQLYIELLRVFDYFLRRHKISYLMMDGTLLGSYTHHDFLPWDDDVDLRMFKKDRSRMFSLLRQEYGNNIRILNVATRNFGSYDMVYFPWTPQAGIKNWSYPNVHITYLDENATHIWRAFDDAYPSNGCSISKDEIFPIVWRPFSQIWLPAPREPLAVFEFLQWKSFETMHYVKNYSHKHERAIPFTDGRARVSQLHPYYPWVKRYCSELHCFEQLLIYYNDSNITIHTVQFEKYRIKLLSDFKLHKKACLF